MESRDSGYRNPWNDSGVNLAEDDVPVLGSSHSHKSSSSNNGSKASAATTKKQQLLAKQKKLKKQLHLSKTKQAR